MSKIKFQIKFFLFFAIFFMLFALPFSIKGACNSATPTAGGLISATTVTGLTTSDTCINSPLAALSVGEIPTFNEMKVTYYDHANPPTGSNIVKMSPLNNTADLNSLSSTNNQIYYINGDLTLNGSNIGGSTKSAVFFINGRLIIRGDVRFNSASSGLVFIVGGHSTNSGLGNIYVAPSVTQVDAVLMADGNIYTASGAGSACSTSLVNVSSPLVINGSLMTLNTGSIVLCRNLASSSNIEAAEQVNYQPKYLVILRDLIPYNRPIWKEITGL
jgi:hypothetical protein